MPGKKSVTKSFTLNLERDGEIIEYLSRPGINNSATIRAALAAFISLETQKDEAMALLLEIREILNNGSVVTGRAQSQDKYDDPFLDQGL